MMCDRVSKSSTVGVGAIGLASLGGMCFLGGMAEAMSDTRHGQHVAVRT